MKALLSILAPSVIALAIATAGSASADQPGKHPAFLHALSDLRFARATGVLHRPQSRSTLDRVEALALALDDFTLAGLALAASLFTSAVLALALQRGVLSGDEAFELSRLDEAFQEEQWGIDAEAAERTERLRAEAVMLDRWFRALVITSPQG